jgi:hypothetical protein
MIFEPVIVYKLFQTIGIWKCRRMLKIFNLVWLNRAPVQTNLELWWRHTGSQKPPTPRPPRVWPSSSPYKSQTQSPSPRMFPSITHQNPFVPINFFLFSTQPYINSFKALTFAIKSFFATWKRVVWAYHLPGYNMC